MKETNDFLLLKKNQEIDKSDHYLKISELKDGFSYKIYARNAYVGVWVIDKKSFLISRYKMEATPYIFHEFHWDTGNPFGTVKPLELIEKFPFDIKDDFEAKETHLICSYLDDLENNNPIIKGMTTATDRKNAAIHFLMRLSGQLKNNKT